MEPTKKHKSREYPALSLRKAVELARRIYEKDKFAETPAIVAVKHIGFGGMNGNSRTALSAIRKYGLLEYTGSGENLRVRLTDLAKRIFLALNEQEKAEAIWEALSLPQLNSELIAEYPNWDLPSQETLSIRLERDFRMQSGAVKSYVGDLLESLEFARSFQPALGNPNLDLEDRGSDGPERQGGGDGTGDSIGSESGEPDLIRIPMPGSPAFIVLPERLEPRDAKRILRWLKTVVTPTIEFAAESDDETAGANEAA